MSRMSNCRFMLRRRSRSSLRCLIWPIAIISSIAEGFTAIPALEDVCFWVYQFINPNDAHKNSESFVKDNPGLLAPIAFVAFCSIATDFMLEGYNAVQQVKKWSKKPINGAIATEEERTSGLPIHSRTTTKSKCHSVSSKCRSLLSCIIWPVAIVSSIAEGFTSIPAMADVSFWIYQFTNKNSTYPNSEKFVVDNSTLFGLIAFVAFCGIVTDFLLEGYNAIQQVQDWAAKGNSTPPVPIDPDLEGQHSNADYHRLEGMA